MKNVTIYAALLLVATNLVAAQSIHNSTSIFIPDAITVYSGDVDNNGLILNNGTIETTGNWNNQRVYQGLGTIVLSGADQSIDNNDQAVEHLLIDGAGIKTLTGKLIIDGSIDFATGIIDVGDNDTLFVRDKASIEGGSEISFVEGALTIEGTGYKFFPIGRNGAYYPVSLNDIRGADLTTQLAAFKNMPAVETSSGVDIDRSVYWKRQSIKGSFSGSPVSAPVGINTDAPENIVFVTGSSLAEVFNVVETFQLQSSGVITFAVSKSPVEDSYFAIGERFEKSGGPAYLSTSLSPNATNPDNRLVKFFSSEVNSDNFHFVVYNRWGNTVFESRSFNAMTTDGWNGKDGGQLLPAGAYPYSLSYVDKTGKEQTARGFVSIIY